MGLNKALFHYVGDAGYAVVDETVVGKCPPGVALINNLFLLRLLKPIVEQNIRHSFTCFKSDHFLKNCRNFTLYWLKSELDFQHAYLCAKAK
jgi:hypothetical protein